MDLKTAKQMMDANNGNLDLRYTEITKLPDNLVVGGNLYLSHTKITELSDNLTVGGYLDLSFTAITELPDSLTVGGSLDLRNTKITKRPDNLTVGGSLYLSNTPITELPDNLTVGGSLDLSCTKITKLPDNLTVGCWLDLSHTEITKLPDNLTVGGGIYLGLHKLTSNRTYKKLKDGDYVPHKYLYADGILTLVKSCHEVDVYTLYIGKIKGQNVVSDGKYYAHCKNLRDGIADIAFKKASERGADQFKKLTLDSVFPIDEAARMYRIITGACKAGTEQFVKSLKNPKKEYTVREMIDMTNGQYNSERFREFFE